MENLYNGRATVNEFDHHIDITIPSRKIYFIMIFFSIWLSFWIIGGLGAIIINFFENTGGFPVIPFVLLWLLFTSIMMLFIGRPIWWMIFGKEIIIVEPGVLTVMKKGAWFVKPKSYNLNDAQNFRVQEDYMSVNRMWGANNNMLRNVMATGTIRFDYGMKTIKIAGGIDEAEATYLLKMLKNKKLLSESNFS